MTVFQILAANVASIALLQWLSSLWLRSRLEASIRHEYDERLERVRVDLALGAEVARRRAEVVGSVWERIVRYQAAWYRHSMLLTDHLFQKVGEHHPEWLAQGVPHGLLERLSYLAEAPQVAPDEEWEKRLDDAMEAPIRTLVQEGYHLVEQINVNGFWLGVDLERELVRWVDDLTKAFSELSPEPEDRDQFRRVIQTLKRSRPDALYILQRSMSGAAAA